MAITTTTVPSAGLRPQRSGELTPIESKVQTALAAFGPFVKYRKRDSRFWRAWRHTVLLRQIFILLILPLVAIPLSAREKDKAAYGEGFMINVPFPETEVVQAVQEVVQNGIIRGTKEYNKDEYVSGATAVDSTKVFSDKVEGGGRLFYKVRLKAIDPRNFKDSNDVGTLAVRYFVKAQDDHHTILRIDARFVEDFRHVMHASNGSVESAEFKDIHDHLDALALNQVEANEAKKSIEAERQQRDQKAQQTALTDSTQASPAPALSEPPVSANSVSAATGTTETSGPIVDAQPQATPLPENLEERVKELRRQVERKVKAPGAPLKSAPFHTASNLQSLPPGTEVLIVISTTYWLGVETHDGQHGWMLRDELEPVE